MNDIQDKQNSSTSPTVTLVLVCLAQFLTPFMFAAVNIALPTIGRELNASAVQLSLAMTFYVLGLGLLMLPIGRFADIYGRKKIFLIGSAIVAVSTLGVGLSSSIHVFLIFRFIQGAGSAFIFSTSVAILTSVYPPERRGWAIGVSTAIVYIGHSLGPSLSGFIIRYLDWRGIFFVVAGLIGASLVLTIAKMRGEWTSAEGESFDYRGTVIFVISLSLIVFGASWITKYPLAKWGVVGGLCGLVVFSISQSRSRYPMLDVRMMISNPAFSFSNLATFLNYTAASSFAFLLSLYLQYVKGLTPEKAGLLLIIQPVVQAFLAPLVGRLSDRYSASIIATIGMGLCAIGSFAIAVMNRETSLIYIIGVLILLGLSIGLFSTSNMTAIMNSVGPRYQGTASSMVGSMRTMGMLFSTTSLAVILSFYLGDSPVTFETIPGFLSSKKTALVFFGTLCCAGTALSMVKGRLPSGKAMN